jgi:hypothetical protein
MNEAGAKQQIVEKIKNNSNILVTVSTNPSVDELSAALGLTLLLNKMKKHATAVFSGAIPPAINFLDPEKTFENTVDSLRDFIIALDKEKADHLRYKVEGEVVKIFITPYRTTITGDDLDFSQGDYNVELVLALGVKSQDHLDTALSAHGRILHDAAVVTVSVGTEKSELGSIDWCEENASSLSEMLVSLSDSLKGDKPLLDEQIATSFLTGIVAATDRFSNNRTSSKVMTIAAQLMAAGANQQLIAAKLQEAHEIGNDTADDTSQSSDSDKNSDGTTNLSEGESTKLEKKQPKSPKTDTPTTPKLDDGSLTISHEKKGNLDEVAEQTASEQQSEATRLAEVEIAKQAVAVPSQNQEEAAKLAEQNLAEQLASVTSVVDAPSVADLQQDLAAASADIDRSAQEPLAKATAPAPLSGAVSSDVWKSPQQTEPLMGGTLNATTEEAADEARRDAADDRNHTLLSHNSGSYVGDSTPTYQSSFNAASQAEEEAAIVDPMQDSGPGSMQFGSAAPIITVQPPVVSGPTLADIDQQNRAPHEEARAAVEAAFDAPTAPVQSFAPELPPLPPMPDFSTLPPIPQPTEYLQTSPMPDTLGSILPPTATPPPVAPIDPGQFKIPGQN